MNIYIKGQCITAHVLQDYIALKYPVTQVLKQWGTPEITSTIIKHSCVWKESLHHT
jgi:hypothetical protein